jgi:uncharacterized membrane protein
MFFRYLLPFNEWSVRLNSVELWAYKLFYYSLIFIPLGILLGLIATISANKFAVYSGLSLGGIILPASLLEAIWASGAHRSFSFTNLGLAIGLLSITTLITTRYLAWNIQKYLSEGRLSNRPCLR